MDSGFTDAVRVHAYLFFNHIVRRIFPNFDTGSIGLRRDSWLTFNRICYFDYSFASCNKRDVLPQEHDSV